MRRVLTQFALLIRDYDEAIEHYCNQLGFVLVEDTKMTESKRWVVVRPSQSEEGAAILLARAKNEEELAAVGNRTGGRVFLFLHTDDIDRDHASFSMAGIEFLEKPRVEEYGKVVVFKDLYGNKWDLIQPARYGVSSFARMMLASVGIPCSAPAFWLMSLPSLSQ